MDAFKAFTALTLVDMISGPLAMVRAAMNATDAATRGLGTRLGNLALAMAPVAVAAGVILGAFGMCVSTAAGFEQALSGVAARSRASAEDLALLEKSARDLGASTSFTAVQVVQAQDELVKKGFSVNQIVASMPGLLSLAAATASDLALASNVTTAALNSFGLAAEKAGEVADIMAAASTGSATDINGLAMALQNAGGVVSSLNGDFALLAALQGKLQDKGIGDSVAATGIKIMFTRLSAPIGEAQKAIDKLGVTTRDAQGNMLPFLDIMGQMEKSLAGLGTAEQAEALKRIFGDEAAGTVMALFKSGTASIGEFAEKLRNSGGAAAEMASRQLDNLAGDVTILGSGWEGLSITIGKLFIPVARKLVQVLIAVVEWVNTLASSPAGAFFIKLLAAASTAVIAITAFSGAMWGVSRLAPIVIKALAPLKAAILGLGWPFLAVIAAIGALYAAYQNNFGGIADTIDRWYKNISLVCRGVIEVFRNLSGETGVIRGELAKEIKAAGLEGFVTTVSKIVFRVKEIFAGIWEGLDFTRPLAILAPIGDKLAAIFEKLGQLFARVFGSEVTTASAGFREFGNAVGVVASWALEGLAVMVNNLANGLGIMIDLVRWIAAVFTGDWASACQIAQGMWDALVDSLLSVADLFRIGDWLRAAWAEATEYLGSINLFESGARILETLKEGILSAAGSVIDGVKGVFSDIREYLPFSDAKTGPFSDLTLSGTRLMTTLAEGAAMGAPALVGKMSGIFSDISKGIGSWWDGLFTDAPEQLAGVAPDISPPPVQGEEAARNDGQEQERLLRGNSYTIHIGSVSLPNAKDGQSFMADLENFVMEYGGGLEG